MSDTVKICVNCGPLTEEMVFHRTLYGKPIIKCRHCTNIAGRRCYYKSIGKEFIEPEKNAPEKPKKIQPKKEIASSQVSFISKSNRLLLQAELELPLETDLRVQIEALQQQIHNLQHQAPTRKMSPALARARQNERSKDYAKRSALHVTDPYVKKYLIHNMKLPKEIINEDLIETFRAQIKITRKIKELKNDGNK